MALSYLDNGTLKIGVYDPSSAVKYQGGSIGHFGPSGGSNWVDNVDEGRQIQQSYYGDLPDYLQPGKTWSGSPWPWNPIQTPGTSLDFSNDGTTIYSKCKPFDWGSVPNIVHEDCVMEQWVKLLGAIAVVKCRFTYTGPRQGLHVAEIPAVFITGLLTLKTYEGDSPWTGGALSSLNPGFPNVYGAHLERWWAWVNGSDDGVGIYVPKAVPFWEQGEKKLMNVTYYKVANVSYVSPLARFELISGCSYEYVYYLSYGNVDTMRARFKALYDASVYGGAGWTHRGPPLFAGGVPVQLSANGELVLRRPSGGYVRVDVGVNKDNPMRLVLPNGQPIGIG